MGDVSRKTILIVEDDQDAIDAMELVLKDEGYRVISALNADAALDQVHSQKPDLILLDVMMPAGTEGFHFVWTLRRDPDLDCRSIPILILTAIHQTTSLKLYPDQSDSVYTPYEYLPVQGFLDKPASSEDVISEVRRVLKEAGAARRSDQEARDQSQ